MQMRIVRGNDCRHLCGADICFCPHQLRSTADSHCGSLTVLPYVWPEAVGGLFIGCLLANILGGLGIWDIVLGSLATLVAALLTRKMPKIWLAPLPPVVANGLIVGGYLSVLYHMPLQLTIGYVAAGQAIACYLLGLILLHIMLKYDLDRL